MKKFIGYLILFSVLSSHAAFCFAEVIEDRVVLEGFAGKTFSKPTYSPTLIQDENLTDLKSVNLKKETYKPQFFEDEAVPVLKAKNYSKPTYQLVLIQDNVTPLNDPKFKGLSRPKVALHYRMIDGNADVAKIAFHSVGHITTKEDLNVGDKVSFQVKGDVLRDGDVFIKDGTLITGSIELISKAAYYGDPDEIEIANLTTKDAKGNLIELEGVIRKQGADRGKWVRPLYNAGVSVPVYGAPLMAFYFVKGGKVKLTPKQEFVFYY
jgi:hypothetical protein